MIWGGKMLFTEDTLGDLDVYKRQAVSLANQAGQLDLNVMTPIITHNILISLKLLNNYLPVFQSRCVDDISIKESRLTITAGMNPSLATLLSPKIGYLKAVSYTHLRL